MTPKISSQDVERMREVPIHTLLGLTNRGRRVTIRCPFHQDKTASLSIYPNNGFHCFGCGAHGKNAIDFVAKLSGEEDPSEAFKVAIRELKDYV